MSQSSQYIDEDRNVKNPHFKTPEQGAATEVWCATSPQASPQQPSLPSAGDDGRSVIPSRNGQPVGRVRREAGSLLRIRPGGEHLLQFLDGEAVGGRATVGLELFVPERSPDGEHALVGGQHGHV